MAEGSAAKAGSPWRPVVRKIRLPSEGRIAAASASEPTWCQSSPGCSSHPGRVSRSRGRPVCAQAATACALIVSANGWVASTTACTPSARAQSARPAAPPNPPTRTSPAGSTGLRTRPASELMTRRPGRPASSAASARASDVPPSTSTVSTTVPAPTPRHHQCGASCAHRGHNAPRSWRPASVRCLVRTWGSQCTALTPSPLSCPPQQVGVHDPALAGPRLAAGRLDLVRDVAQVAGNEDLVLGPDVRTPVDLDAGLRDAGERAGRVQHHDHIVAMLGKATLGQPAAGGDVDRLADLGQAHPVPGSQRLHAADSGDDLVLQLQGALRDDLLDDRQSAVVQRRVPPDQEGAALPVA